MSDFRPLTDEELDAMEQLADYDLGVHAEEGDQERLRSMVQEIRTHRSVMAARCAETTRLYSNVAELARAARPDLERSVSEAVGTEAFCKECGHEHADASWGFICIGCPCDVRPPGVWP